MHTTCTSHCFICEIKSLSEVLRSKQSYTYLQCDLSQRSWGRNMVLSEEVYPDEPVVQYSLSAAVSLFSLSRAGELDQGTFWVTLIPYLDMLQSQVQVIIGPKAQSVQHVMQYEYCIS